MTRVHIISGFLGAGKTTLLLKLLAFVEGNKVIIENEFGEVGIDGDVLQRANYDVVEMAQGCICCSLTMPVVVVDALEYLMLVEEFGLFYKDQIAHAGIMVLSKVQHMREDNLEVIIKSLRALNPRADIMARDWEQFSEMDYWELTNTVFNPEKTAEVGGATSILPGGLQSYSLTAPKRINRENLQYILNSLQNQQLGKIIRAKGFVEGDNGSLEFNYVNGRYTIHDNSWGNSSRVCIIGSNLNRDMLSGIWSGDGVGVV